MSARLFWLIETWYELWAAMLDIFPFFRFFFTFEFFSVFSVCVFLYLSEYCEWAVIIYELVFCKAKCNKKYIRYTPTHTWHTSTEWYDLYVKAKCEQNEALHPHNKFITVKPHIYIHIHAGEIRRSNARKIMYFAFYSEYICTLMHCLHCSNAINQLFSYNE